MSRIESVAKTLVVGSVFYENGYGRSIKLICISTPVCNDSQWTWKAMSECGKEIDYLITEGLEHYGPKVSLEPDYWS